MTASARSPKSTRLGVLLLGFALLLGSALLTGCADSVFSAEETVETQRPTDDAKFRHAHLMERAYRADPGKSASSASLGLIVALLNGVDKQRLAERYRLLQRYRLATRYEYDNVFDGFAWSIEDLEGSSDYQEFLDALTADPEVLWFEPDFDMTSPDANPMPGGSGQEIPWSVAAVGGQTSWTVSGDGQGSVDVDVYILDTGVAQADPNDGSDDLALVENIDFREGLDDAADHDGHGTHVAGIVAAVDDNDGIVGLAPNARVHNLKVLGDDGKGDVSQVIAAIEHITAAKLASPGTPMVVNLSLGEDVGNNVYSALDEAVDASTAAGVVYVVAAGNHGKNASSVTPAKCDAAITVGAYDFNGSYSGFSNWGSQVDILAPGEGVVSMSPAGSGNTVEMTGTSMAAAHVTGAAALYLAQHPSATPAQVRAALLASAQDFVTDAPSSTTTKSVWVGGGNGGGGTTETYRDEFNVVSYGNNDGTATWAGDWTEIGESNGPGNGHIQVVNFPNSSPVLGLRVREGRGVQRPVDLSGAVSAVLSFDYRRVNFDQSSDHATLDISDDGGATWTQLDIFQGPDRDSDLQPASYDISAYASSNTLIRFMSSSSVDGGERVYFKDVQIEINGNGGGNPPPPPPPPPPPGGTSTTFEARVASANDDAEENVSNGDMYLDSSDLELISDGSTAQLVGMRFTGVSIPQGAVITNAYVQFTVDETDSGAANLTLRGQDADDAAGFTSSADNISDRPTTSASASWSPPAWTSVGAAGADQRTPDLSSIIQEIVDRGGWSSGNDMVLIVTGTGERTAESHDGDASKAPLLHVEWTTGPGGSPPPPPTGSQTVDVRVASDNDDAEENVSNGDMYLDSSDLELISDGSTAQLVGMRFTGVSIPQGAVITNAYVQFTVDETDSGAANLTLRGQDADDAAGFSSSADNISDRPTTSASKSWSPPAWTSVGAAGADQRTPDLSSIIQEIVDRGGWSSGNDMVLIVTGTGERTAESHGGDASKAPLLHVEYQ